MSRITVIGGTGYAGSAIVAEAASRGHEVTALSRYSDMPAAGPGELPAEERNLVLHAELPITGGHLLMATDMLGSMGQQTRIGNNTTLWPGQTFSFRRHLSRFDPASYVVTALAPETADDTTPTATEAVSA